MGLTGWLRGALVRVCVFVPLAHRGPSAPVLQAELLSPLHLLRGRPATAAELTGHPQGDVAGAFPFASGKYPPGIYFRAPLK